jgi:hypothetical protein
LAAESLLNLVSSDISGIGQECVQAQYDPAKIQAPSPPTLTVIFHLWNILWSSSSNTEQDLPPPTHTTIYLLQYSLWFPPPTRCTIFLKHTPQYSSSTHHNRDNLTKLTTPCSLTSCQCCDPPSPCDPSSVSQKKQIEGVARQHGMWNVGVVCISPCHWSVSKMKVCDWWARSQGE